MDVVRTTANPPVPPVFGGQRIGKIDRGFWLRDSPLVAGRDIGQSDGYTSLGRATAALRKITLGDAVGAAAIFEHGGRYYAQTVILDAQGGMRPFHAMMFGERGIRFQNDAVQAIVDGGNYWDRQVASGGPR